MSSRFGTGLMMMPVVEPVAKKPSLMRRILAVLIFLV